MAPAVVHLPRMPARRPLEDVRRRIAGGWREVDAATVEDGLSVADRIQLELDALRLAPVLDLIAKRHP